MGVPRGAARKLIARPPREPDYDCALVHGKRRLTRPLIRGRSPTAGGFGGFGGLERVWGGWEEIWEFEGFVWEMGS